MKHYFLMALAALFGFGATEAVPVTVHTHGYKDGMRDGMKHGMRHGMLNGLKNGHLQGHARGAHEGEHSADVSKEQDGKKHVRYFRGPGRHEMTEGQSEQPRFHRGKGPLNDAMKQPDHPHFRPTGENGELKQHHMDGERGRMRHHHRHPNFGQRPESSQAEQR